MNGSQRPRVRPATMDRRKELARSLLLEIVREELLVAQARKRRAKSWTPGLKDVKQRGKSGMTRPLKVLKWQVAGEAGVSLSYVEKAWSQCRLDAIKGIAAEIAGRLADPKFETQQQRRRDQWPAERAKADAAWAQGISEMSICSKRRT